MNPMRTTLDLPEALIEEARRELGFKSKTDTVVLALTELIRWRARHSAPLVQRVSRVLQRLEVIAATG